MSTVAPPGWYPDPARAHQYRYFDGGAWTDHVSDNGVAGQAPLGPMPPGMLGAYPPAAAMSGAYRRPLLNVPRAKMWIFAVLSLFVFWINTPGTRLVLPLGIIFAIMCWRVTSEPLREHEQAGSPAVGEMKAARWVAVGLAIVSASQAVIFFR